LQTGKPESEFDKLEGRTFPIEKYMAYSQLPIIEVDAGLKKNASPMMVVEHFQIVDIL
jgi:hypothetical protein